MTSGWLAKGLARCEQPIFDPTRGKIMPSRNHKKTRDPRRASCWQSSPWAHPAGYEENTMYLPKLFSRKRRNSRSPTERRLTFESVESRVLMAVTVPALNSNSGAANTLYLDFDGIRNSPLKNGTTKDFLAMDFDNDPSNFSAFEQDLIRDIHKRVAEDFSPFDINVTTIDPEGDSGIDQTKVWTTAIGHFSDTSDRGSSGGYGVIRGVPVAWDNRIGPNAAKIAGTISHESGHKFGLEHQATFDVDGELIQQYSKGGADWTPIMGNSLQTDRTIWWNGKNVYGEYQDDVAILAKLLGYRRDVHADSPGWFNTYLGDTKKAAPGPWRHRDYR